MSKRITKFVELKAYVDIFNERGHPGFLEPINAIGWWNNIIPGTIIDGVKIYNYNGIIIILEESMDGLSCTNVQVFSINKQRKDTFAIILRLLCAYQKVTFNSEIGNKYKYIVKKSGGKHFKKDGKHFYSVKKENINRILHKLFA